MQVNVRSWIWAALSIFLLQQALGGERSTWSRFGDESRGEAWWKMGKRMGKGDCSRRRASQEIGPKTRGGESLLLDDDCGGRVTGQDTKDDELNFTMPAGVAFEDQN